MKIMSDKQSVVFDFIATIIGVSTGVASTLDTVEQWGRIVLLFLSIISGILLILVNWQKGMDQFKRFFK